MEHQLSFLASSKSTKKSESLNSIDKKHSQKQQWHLYVDGASRGNPGPSGAGIHLLHNSLIIYQEGFFLGEKTNNQAEYLALVLGLIVVNARIKEKNITLKALHIISDSQLLIHQMTGVYKVKDSMLQKLKQCADVLRTDFICTFSHVLREKNSEADQLANKGIDLKNPIPQSFIRILKHYT